MDGKKSFSFGFNYQKPSSLVNAFESLLQTTDAKNALQMAEKIRSISSPNDILARYYEVLCLEALADVGGAKAGASIVGLLCAGETSSDHPKLDAKGQVFLPQKFFARYPEIQSLRDGVRQFKDELSSRFKPSVALFGNKTKGLDRRVFLGEAAIGTFEYWPIEYSRIVNPAGSLESLERDQVARWLIRGMVARSLGVAFPKLPRQDASVVTFGSCFAVNLATSLQEQGIQARSFRIEEVVNTTRANRLFLDYLLHGNESETDYFSQSISPEMAKSLKETISTATHMVLTVGVSPVIEWKSSGKLCLVSRNYRELFERGEVVQRFTSVEENRDNIVAIIDGLREVNSQAEIFVTLSPVPLLGVADGSSVIMRDVMSKATLRLAIDEASKRCGFQYWPSFELVKWVAPHVGGETGYQAYAENDKNSRHVSRWLIDVVTSEFANYAFESDDNE